MPAFPTTLGSANGMSRPAHACSKHPPNTQRCIGKGAWEGMGLGSELGKGCVGKELGRSAERAQRAPQLPKLPLLVNL